MSSDNHITVLWAAKGGSGTTVTTAAAAIHEPQEVIIVDLGGDMTDVLATPRPTVGLDDWLLAEPTNDLDDLLVDVDPTTRLLPTRSPIDLDQVRGERVDILASWMRNTATIVLVDAGTGPPSEALIDLADRNLIVTRPCYLALIKAVRTGQQPDGIVLINEPSRSLNSTSVEQSLSAPIVATIDAHPSIARSVDAGLLTAGHNQFTRGTAAITRPDPTPTALDRWRSLDERRHSPDVDYGMHWRTGGADEHWRVSWNRGSGALYATNRDETVVEDLATFTSEIDATAALPEWGTHHRDPDGLDWVRQQVEFPTLSHDLPGPSL
jgi:hypothetical protein